MPDHSRLGFVVRLVRVVHNGPTWVAEGCSSVFRAPCPAMGGIDELRNRVMAGSLSYGTDLSSRARSAAQPVFDQAEEHAGHEFVGKGSAGSSHRLSFTDDSGSDFQIPEIVEKALAARYPTTAAARSRTARHATNTWRSRVLPRIS